MKNTIILITALNVVCLAGYMFISQSNQIARLESYVSISKERAQLQDSQINDLLITRSDRGDNSYQQGYEAGRLNMGVLFMQGDSALNYSDGYHAALEQFGGDTPVSADVVIPDDNLDSLFLDLFRESISAGELEIAMVLYEIINDELEFMLELKVDEAMFVEETLLLRQLEEDLKGLHVTSPER